jgi:hypothetical protein
MPHPGSSVSDGLRRMLEVPAFIKTGRFEDQDVSNCTKDSAVCCELCCGTGTMRGQSWAFVRGEPYHECHSRRFDPFWFHQNLRLVRGMPTEVPIRETGGWLCITCRNIREVRIIQAQLANTPQVSAGPDYFCYPEPGAQSAVGPPAYASGPPPPAYGGAPSPAPASAQPYYQGGPPPGYGGPPPPGYEPAGYAPQGYAVPPPVDGVAPDGGYAAPDQ